MASGFLMFSEVVKRRYFGALIANLEHIPPIFLVFLLLTLSINSVCCVCIIYEKIHAILKTVENHHT